MKQLWLFLSFASMLTMTCNTASSVTQEPTAVPQSTQSPLSNPSTSEPTTTSSTTDALSNITDIFAEGGPPGSSRSWPLPLDQILTGQNWEATVLEMVRGEDAWQQLYATNQFNDPAPEGQEYLLLRLRLKITGNSNEPYIIYPAVTGDRYIRYSAVAAVTPEPRLPGEFTAGQTIEGWLPYLVNQGEGNLILVVRELGNMADPARYLALTEAASVPVPPDLDGIPATESGRDANAPTPIGQTATAEDWELTVLDAELGDKAWQMITHANQFNDPPPDGRQYAAVWLRLRYIGPDEGEPRLVYPSWFTGRSGSVAEETPSVVDPQPALDGLYLYPGAQVEGWIIIVVADEPGEPLTLVFDPDTLTDANRRFLALPATGR
jgi:hypothetical protein